MEDVVVSDRRDAEYIALARISCTALARLICNRLDASDATACRVALLRFAAETDDANQQETAPPTTCHDSAVWQRLAQATRISTRMMMDGAMCTDPAVKSRRMALGIALEGALMTAAERASPPFLDALLSPQCCDGVAVGIRGGGASDDASLPPHCYAVRFADGGSSPPRDKTITLLTITLYTVTPPSTPYDADDAATYVVPRWRDAETDVWRGEWTTPATTPTVVCASTIVGVNLPLLAAAYDQHRPLTTRVVGAAVACTGIAVAAAVVILLLRRCCR